MDKLKPCPFCGGEPFKYFFWSVSNGTFLEIICKKCKCQIGCFREAEAIKAWNRMVNNDERRTDAGTIPRSQTAEHVQAAAPAYSRISSSGAGG